MVKNKLKHLIIFVSTLSLIGILFITLSFVKASEKDITITVDNEISSSDLLQYDSSLYTNVESYKTNEYKGSLNEKDEFVTKSANNQYALYFNKDLCIFKVQNLATGYIYASANEEVLESSCTNYYAGMVSSSFVIEYYKYNTLNSEYNTNVLSAWINKALAYSKAEKEELGEMSEYPYKISTAPETKYTYQYIDNGVKVTIDFANATEMRTEKSHSLGISITAYVTLDNEGLHVSIPTEEIVESDTNLLANIIVMPFMGSTFNNQTDGYMIIPDGSGALIRYGSVDPSLATQLSILYYGSNEGRVPSLTTGTKVFNKDLSAPVFGLINGVKQDGVYGIIESGDSQASILISPNGALNIKYNYLTCRFTKRYHYLLYGVNTTVMKDLYEEDIKLSYHFLSNNDATYVGMASDYQDYLVNNNLLKQTTSNKNLTGIDFLLSETTTALIGYKNVTMTKIKDAEKILDELASNGVNDYNVVLYGWSKKGNSGNTPSKVKFNTKVGSTSAYKSFIKSITDNNNKVYLYNDYVEAYSRGNMSYQKDVAKNNQRIKMVETNTSNVFQKQYYLYPESTKNILLKDVKKYQKYGVTSIALDSIGDTLFSYYDNDNVGRDTSKDIYEKTLEEVSSKLNIGLFEPSSYMWKYLDSYLNMTVFTTNYTMYSDTIPFIPYVLKGYVDCFSDYVNFSALGNDHLLRLLDYGCFPAYLLTTEISYNLKYTDSYHLYTTAYTDWKDSIINNYHTYNDGYVATLNSKVVDRIVVEPGLVVVIYQNSTNKAYTSIIINYLSNEKMINGNSVNAQSYKVVGGNIYE